jgi:hypothetical protein
MQSFALGLFHGLAGSAGVTILLLAAVPQEAAAGALVVLAAGTAVSMTALSAAFGSLLGGARARRSLAHAVPALACTAVLFGTWYAAGALAA